MFTLIIGQLSDDGRLGVSLAGGFIGSVIIFILSAVILPLVVWCCREKQGIIMI